MTVDPVDDCTFWYTNEYLKTNGTWNWSTWISSFRFPGCGSTGSPDFSLTATPASQTVLPGAATSYSVSVSLLNGSGPVTLSTSGWPTGAGGTFSTNPASSTSTLNVTTSSTTPTGSYPITISGTNGSTTHTASVTLVVASSTAGVPSTPQNLVARAGPGKGVNLSWSPPTSDGGSAITAYRVYRGPTSDTATMSLIATLGNVTSYKDTSTVKRSTYWYAVSAVNSIGEGALSTSAGPVTPTK